MYCRNPIRMKEKQEEVLGVGKYIGNETGVMQRILRLVWYDS